MQRQERREFLVLSMVKQRFGKEVIKTFQEMDKKGFER